MKQLADNKTQELPNVTAKPGRAKKYASQAEKQAAYRARKGVTAITVMLPNEVAVEFAAWLESKGKKPSAVITHLIKTQLLRKR
jgi:hypothetical protein